MVTVLRESGLRFVIFAGDHDPPHVHVFGDGETKIDLGGLRVIRQIGATRRESRRGLEIVRENRDMLLRRWTEIHG